ncbi:putative Metal dependent phosphohydrolase [Vibrio crassostreae]|uniref:HD domain-containing phosphohydrolase n=1 Tax=Vibrio crassostreae TaxID=246167 RepID=UPI001B313369|nr:HD domain-containing phosphohydrolase [Vibrio crassostreae]CAK2143401.1 putative Metal dependent phosphohydrolase [Vibrio crassostreae]CAK2146723.1 putative Metal dependent phosphohydrolase [Vibrio crassostreae]CAK2167774.1 putative Metal dependent phosphohydrolase [Vibrio crassostreae]CAK2172494.1 putative Metal dependent phosphohydrolase [Vibrio crassostreae]CAK2173834.1 putative Metal dependent phosphohydrolase [Vibrio crassostreae]
MYKLLISIAVLCVSAYSSLSFANDWDIKRILVLHSYEPSYQWTADFQKGIDSAFSQSRTEVKLSIEYLDSKRINSSDYYGSLSNYLQIKYAGYEFDGVIATDDNAANFLESLGALIDRSTPVVAVGINDTSTDMYAVSDRATVLYENDQIDVNIKLISKLRPNLKNLYFVNDYSVTSELIHKKMNKMMAEFPNINLIEIRDLSLEDTSQFLEGISADDAVLLSHYNTELKQGVYHTYQEIADTLSKASAAPVFALWQFYISGDVLGGYVNHSQSMGEEAVDALDKYLPLGFAEPLTPGDNKRFVFNYPAMKRYGISANALPDEAVFINEPSSFIRKNFQLLMGLSMVIAGLSLIILMQFVTLRQKKELANKNKRILKLQKQTLNIQKDMIHVLGEAIETRSGETGNHVKRVAKLSALLAKYRGLSHREIEMIEIISPMHDVGKISVPESILDKPGKLTDQEWEVMKLHTTAGYNLLKSGAGDITNLAAIIANEHHERWDGTGYPNGKVGDEIHLFARITAVADVFDALLSARCYKEPWPLDMVVDLFERECGYQFDPQLTKLLLKHLPEFVAIRDSYPDTGTVEYAISRSLEAKVFEESVVR